MKKICLLLSVLLVFLGGCQSGWAPAQIAATTLPVYEFTARLCSGTPLTVTRLVTESVSCLHDYSLNVRQVKAVEAAQVVVVSGAGLEDFLDSVLDSSDIIDSSEGIALLHMEEEHDHDHDEHDHNHEGHHHEDDPHIWLSPENAKVMAGNICAGLSRRYPEYEDVFSANLENLLADLNTLQSYGEMTLSDLKCRKLVTFHDGFSYFAQAFDLTILEAVEEESGSEASARELKHLIGVVRENDLPAIFTEANGSTSAAGVISRETGAKVLSLDMAMSGSSYFDAMYHNIDTIKEALG